MQGPPRTGAVVGVVEERKAKGISEMKRSSMKLNLHGLNQV